MTRPRSKVASLDAGAPPPYTSYGVDAAPISPPRAGAPDAGVDGLVALGCVGAGSLALDELLLTPAERAAVRALSPLPASPPPDPTNRYANHGGAAALGQMLFFDTEYSGAGTTGVAPGAPPLAGAGLSCRSCHVGPSLAQRSDGIMGPVYGGRAILSLINASDYVWTNWGGRFATQWELPLAVAEKANSINSNRLRIAHLIFDKYRSEYEAVFGPLDPALASDTSRFPLDGKPKTPGAADGIWERMAAGDREIVNRIFVNYGKAIAAYLRRLRSTNAPFDRYVAGDKTALSCSAQRGLALFVGKARCVGCHSGPMFTDQGFHNLGLLPGRIADSGRSEDIPALLDSPFNPDSVWSDDRMAGRLAGLTKPAPSVTIGQFRTPTLRNVALSAPYMHDDSMPTLDAVISFHDGGGGLPGFGVKDAEMRPLGLRPDERADLRSFLESLNGDPIAPALLRDTARVMPQAPLRRLTPNEYARTVAALLPAGPALTALPPAPEVDGFESRAPGLPSVSLVQAYDSAAWEIAGYVRSHSAAVSGCDANAGAGDSCVAAFIGRFGRLAFRRSLPALEVRSWSALFRALRSTLPFDEALSEWVRTLLQAPEMLYRPEVGKPGPSRFLTPLRGDEIAVRLGFLLWGHASDDGLIARAEAGVLDTEAGIAAEAERMLNDPRARVGMVDFFRQWLRLDGVVNVEKDPLEFPSFDRALGASFREAALRYLEDALFTGAPSTEALFTTRTQWVDDRLARHFGLPATGGWRRVPWGGLLEQGWFLVPNTSARETSPTKRGAFLRNRLLCQPVSAGSSAHPTLPGGTAPVRARLESAVNGSAACADCHRTLDGLGTPFEAYDAVARPVPATVSVDVSGAISGTRDSNGPVSNPTELAARLGRSYDLQTCMARRWLEHAAGRALADGEQARLEALIPSAGDPRALLLALVRQQDFRTVPARTQMDAPFPEPSAGAATGAGVKAIRSMEIDFLSALYTRLLRRLPSTDAPTVNAHVQALRELARQTLTAP